MSRAYGSTLILGLLAICTIGTCPPAFASISEDCGNRLRSARPARDDFKTYQIDTAAGLEVMRNPLTGLIRDKIAVIPLDRGAFRVMVMNDKTSPTNIGLDLILQIGRATAGKSEAVANIERIVSSLEKLPYHRPTGLFFSWYSTSSLHDIASFDVSSVDNIHLALALWTTKEALAESSLGTRAALLLERMDFSAFYDQQTGLMGGNLRYGDGQWTLDAYRYDYLGSEGRSIYSVCYALGLLRQFPQEEILIRSIAALTTEMFNWNDKGKIRPILRTWDGGVFQLLLPQLLLNEGTYSPQLDRIFRNYADYAIAQGEDQGILGMPFHSASQYGFDNQTTFTQVPAYQGKAGNPDLVSTYHVDFGNSQQRMLWDMTLTPHAAMMAASVVPKPYLPTLAKIKSLRSGANLLYRSGLGFMDGYHSKGVYRGQVVPVQLSLNQEMIALSLEQMTASDGQGPSARALWKNATVRQRLSNFYSRLDEKLSQVLRQ